MLVRTVGRRVVTALLVGALSLAVGVIVHEGTGAGAAQPGADRGSVMRAINPIRILDSRGGDTGGPTGVATIAPLGAGETLQLQVSGATGQRGVVVPANLVGAMLNVTAANATANSFIRVYPCDGAVPASSTLNPTPGVVGYNSALVALSADGKVCIYNNSGSVDLIVDVTGVQVALDSALTSSPMRIDAADFRLVEGKTGWLAGAGLIDLTAPPDPGFPSDACFAAPVRVPKGGVLQSVHVFAREGLPGAANITGSLSSRVFGSTSGGSTIGTLDNHSGTTFDTDLDLTLTGVSGHAFDTDRAYELRVCINVADVLMGARIDYTMAS
jgi:hypothetical protein